MSKTDEIIYNVTGQVIELYPPEWPEGIPSSATLSVYEGTDSNDDTAEWTATCTVDTVATTVDTASGFSQTDKRKAYLASTGGVTVGRMYLMENPQGQRELVKVKSVAATDYVLTQEPLKYDYSASGSSTLKGVRIYATVDATWVVDETNVLAAADLPYRVVWSYTVNGVARRHYTYLRLVRQPFNGLISIYDISKWLPDVALSEPESQLGRQCRDAIEAAVERVRVDLIASGIQPDSVRDTEVIKELQRAKALEIIALWHNPPGVERELWLQMTREDYKELYTRITSGTIKVPLDKGTEGAVTTKKAEALWLGR